MVRPSSEYELLGEMARKIQILENEAEHLSDAYVWPAPIALEMKVCGSSGARFESGTKTIVVCYEILDEFSELYRMYGHREIVAGPMQTILEEQEGMSESPARAKREMHARWR